MKRKGRQGLETLFFAVTGRVTKVKAEDDGDLHLALEDLNKPGRVVVEIPLGDKWCEMRKRVFAWSRTAFPLPAGRSLNLTREPIVTVVGKAFYDAGHAGGKNRRTYDADLAVWEIHPVMQMTESETIPMPPSASPPPAANPSPPSTAALQELVTVIQPIRILLPFGETTLPVGTKLPVVKRDATTVQVRYLDAVYPLPASAVR